MQSGMPDRETGSRIALQGLKRIPKPQKISTVLFYQIRKGADHVETVHSLEHSRIPTICFAEEGLPLSVSAVLQQLCNGSRGKIRSLARRAARSAAVAEVQSLD